MRIGVSVYNVRAADLVGLAVAADQAGFSSLWLGEHLVLPWGYGSEHPTHGDTPAEELRHATIVEESTELLDPFVALAAAAAVTSRIRLATGIYLLPLRHPLLTARGVASLDDLSGGRFMLGVGSGWLQEEFDALDVPFATRTGRHVESLAVLRAAFRGGPFEHAGRYWQFGPVQVTPRPIAAPIVLGGNSDAALRRAADLADAWFASGNPTFDEAVDLLGRLTAECRKRDRTLETYVRVPKFDPSVVGGYEEAGFDNVLFWAEDICPPGADRRASFLHAAEQLGLG
jgi:probable F420-dependent oxidoreductase